MPLMTSLMVPSPPAATMILVPLRDGSGRQRLRFAGALRRRQGDRGTGLRFQKPLHAPRFLAARGWIENNEELVHG
jgi:hypothetical protein